MYFKKVKSLDDLKNQFKTLARVNHPDAGGDPEIMKAINAEYDQVFPIWRSRYNLNSEKPNTETANSTRREFYTEYGWAGDKFVPGQSLKKIAQNIRAYVKELYPTYKFSITMDHNSLVVRLMEAPNEIYKDWDEMDKSDIRQLECTLRHNHLFSLDSWYPEQLKSAILDAWQTKGDRYKVLNDISQTIINDIAREVNSYRMDDSDGMIDYFCTNFYFLGVGIGKWNKPFKVVPKTARLKKGKSEVTVCA